MSWTIMSTKNLFLKFEKLSSMLWFLFLLLKTRSLRKTIKFKKNYYKIKLNTQNFQIFNIFKEN